MGSWILFAFDFSFIRSFYISLLFWSDLITISTYGVLPNLELHERDDSSGSWNTLVNLSKLIRDTVGSWKHTYTIHIHRHRYYSLQSQREKTSCSLQAVCFFVSFEIRIGINVLVNTTKPTVRPHHVTESESKFKLLKTPGFQCVTAVWTSKVSVWIILLIICWPLTFEEQWYIENVFL